jgi:iron complex outermembrane receptor protein
MHSALINVLALIIFIHPAQVQTGTLQGTVMDATAHGPVAGARVEARVGGRLAGRVITASDGSFHLVNLAPGSYTLSIARMGYDPTNLASVTVSAGQAVPITVQLMPRAVEINPEVVTASRRQEKALDAPASVSVVGREEVAARPSLTAVDYLTGLPGVDVVSSGLTQHNVVTRGFNNAGSGALLVLADNRYAAVASLRINAYNFIPLTEEDLDRVEVVRGPGAALYGPNATAGVMHLITRSPFDSPGTTVTLSGGARSLLQLAARSAGTLGAGGRLGWKLSGQYFRANDFGYVDPEEQASRAAALRAGANPDTLRVGRRDSLIERVSGEARLDIRTSHETTVTGSVGVNDAINNIDITGFGAAQVHGWRYQYAQVRMVRPGMFAQAFYNGSESGTTYQLRTGQAVVDHSRMLVGQFQQVLQPWARETVTWGVDLQRTDPRTDGTIYGRYEPDDLTDEAGSYLHSETHLPWADLVGALRADHHSRVHGIVWSPRVGLVLHPFEGHTLRLTYNRAFSTPTSNDLFLDLLVDSLRDPVSGTATPFAVFATGVPKTGFTFRRDCGQLLGGLCMRSPFAPASLGGRTRYLPADAAQLWAVVVDSLKNRGVDLAGVPAPTSAEVASTLGRLDPASRSFVPIGPADVADLEALGHRITSTLELGYKGLLANRLLLAVDLYYSWYRGFTSEYVATPNVFFDGPTLQAYLARFRPSAQASQLAGFLSTIPVGTISPEQAFDPTEILVTYRNFGRVGLGGLDAAATAQLSRSVTLAGSYSWISENLFSNLSGIGDVALNAPRHKASLAAAFRDEGRGLTANLAARYLGGFPVKSGIFAGQVQPYAVLDANAAYRLPFDRHTTVSLAGWSLLQASQDVFSGNWRLTDRHAEFVRVPQIGRVVVVRIRTEF